MSNEDHRNLSQDLHLLHFQDEAPGMVFWHPRGQILLRLLEDAARTQASADGYLEVRTPQLLRRALWETSGHWQNFRHAMFSVEDDAGAAAIKPVSCPGHIQIANRRPLSYRELPLRLFELGVVHRDEPGGTLHGLMRLRQFTQDDGHVFCAMEDAESEVERFCRSLPPFYAAFGFDALRVALSTRPSQRAGDDASWDLAEATLRSALLRSGVDFSEQAGEGAFYGPKLEFALCDQRGRAWQCGTIQLDLVMPQRFGLRYIDRTGERRPLAMLHRALYGSVERFLGVLLEHHGARLPAWLAPQQLSVLPVASAQRGWAERVTAAFRAAGLRVNLDHRDESLGRRVADARALAIPFIAIAGERECADESLTLRGPQGQRVVALAEALGALAEACAVPRFGEACR